MLANRLKTKMTGAYTELGSVESVIYDNRTERILRVTKSVQIDEIIFEVPFPLLTLLKFMVKRVRVKPNSCLPSPSTP